MKKIDYETMAKHYLSICSKISNTAYEAQKNDKTKEDAKKDYDDMYWSFDRAKSRANDVLEMKKWWNEPDFEHYGLEQLSSARYRIEHFLDDCRLAYPDCCYTYDKYDNIIIDYYEPIRLSRDPDHETAWNKYYKLNHKRIMINLGLKHDIKDAYSYVDEDERWIIDKMMDLFKQLTGYEEDYE